jgi:hypothetical protein
MATNAPGRSSSRPRHVAGHADPQASDAISPRADEIASGGPIVSDVLGRATDHVQLPVDAVRQSERLATPTLKRSRRRVRLSAAPDRLSGARHELTTCPFLRSRAIVEIPAPLPAVVVLVHGIVRGPVITALRSTDAPLDLHRPEPVNKETR